MALPFLNGNSKGRDQSLSIDLGGRTTKAVHLQRKGDDYVLARYAFVDAPIFEKNLTPELLSEHLKNVTQAMDLKSRPVTLAVGVGDSIVRQTEMPLMPVEDMRMILKNNTKIYLQQDLPGYIFDCHIIPPRLPAKPPEKGQGGSNIPKSKVLAAGAKQQYLQDLLTAIKGAGLLPDHIVPAMLGPVNAFEMAMPESFAKEVVALVDIGFRNSTICVLQEGELALNRVVNIGGDKLTAGLAELMGISYAEAEGIKVGMPGEVKSHLESLVSPLGRELRASIDFFEHQQDKTVTKVFISGGSARSEFLVQALQNELLAECHTWNPTSFLQLMLPPQQMSEIEQVAPQLTSAIGAAMAVF
jgi:type IV pilus assembly protein PilM